MTGAESFSQIALRLGLQQKAIEKRASGEANGGKTWGFQREIFRREVAAEIRQRKLQTWRDAAVSIHEAQANAYAAIIAHLAPRALEALRAPDALSTYESVRALIAILQFQRRVHGLDCDARIEVTGAAGNAIEHEVTVGKPFDDRTRASIAHALDDVFAAL